MLPSHHRHVCVFCASSPGNDLSFAHAAAKLGTRLAREGLSVVYGGANVGMMAVLADAALAASGEVIGVIPQALLEREIAHPELTQLYIVKTMHERKAMMADLSDAFIALPGGFGTLDEFCEVVTWAQLEIHQKPCVLVNLNGYYDDFLSFLERAVSDGLLQTANRGLIRAVDTPEEAIDLILAHWATQPERAETGVEVPPEAR